MIRKKCYILMLCMIAVFLCSDVHAGKNRYGFSDRLNYDVYFYSAEEHVSVIENVVILGFQQIAGKEFLVLKSKGLKLTEEEGFILFDSVVAILPNRNFKVHRSNAINIGHQH